jgi:hypothetical protein
MDRKRISRSIPLALAGVSLAVASCSRDPRIEERPVVVYSPRACALAESEAYSVMYASGDFEPSTAEPSSAGVFLRDVGKAMPELPVESKALVVDVSQGDVYWRGLTTIAHRGPINVLVWPGANTCNLTSDVERRTDSTFAVVGKNFLVAGGRSFDGAQVPHTFVGDLSTGAITELAVGLGTRRSRPTITSFKRPTDGDGPSAALVAGGHDPDSETADGTLRAISTAEVYVPQIGAPNDVGEFDAARIDLSEPRAHHAAVVLSSGETLLVGGRGADGPLRTMEIVDPISRRARTAGVALLRVARENPTVIRLSNGEILVAGGIDANKQEIATLEWFSPDASREAKRPVDLVTGKERAFVPLEAGGALAVVRPTTNTPDFKTVWIISADGTLEPGEPLDPTYLDMLRLFPGTDGAPALWTGRRWLRWSPWLARFDAMTEAPDPEHDPLPGPRLDAIANGDPGLAMWLDDDTQRMNVVGFRFATRTPFDRVPSALLVSGTDHFAPDRIATGARSTIRFDPTLGLVLGAGASAFLTDLTFASFDATLDVTADAPTIVLRPDHGSELEIGGASCAFGQSARRSLHVIRRGTRVSVSADDAPARDCPTPLDASTRISIGLRGTQGALLSAGRNLRVTRR